jgi:type IV pilus assembly protein PilX
MGLTHPPRRGLRSRSQPPRRQKGMVLLVAVMVLALMFMASLGVMRAADTGNVIAGNYSFQQAAVQSSDRAITDAVNTLSGLAVGNGANTSIANRYFAIKQTPLDARGIPTAISATDWAGVNCVDPAGVAVADCATDAGNYRIQYVIERMCVSNPDFTNINDIRAKCEYEASATALSASSIAVRYRVMVRVRGPRGTEGYYEAMVSGPAST